MDILTKFLADTKSNTLHSFVYTITPDIAVYVLQNLNLEKNRQVAAGRINLYRQAMIEGEWIVADSLKFNVDGILCDGQHRLHAVVKANIPVDFLITVGYPHESVQVFDRGNLRTLAHVATLQGNNWIKPRHISTFNTLFLCLPNGNDAPSEMTDAYRLDCIDRLQKGMLFSSEKYRHKTAIECSAFKGVVVRAFYSNFLNKYPNEFKEQLLKHFIFYFHGFNPMSSPQLFSSEFQDYDPTMIIRLRELYLSKNWYKHVASNGGRLAQAKFLVCQKVLRDYIKQKGSQCHLSPLFENLFPSQLIDSMID